MRTAANYIILSPFQYIQNDILSFYTLLSGNKGNYKILQINYVC